MPERVRIFLDPQPLVAEIQRWREDGHLIQDLSFDSGVPDRTIRRYVSGERGHIRYDCADRLAAALDIPLNAVYPNFRDWSGGAV